MSTRKAIPCLGTFLFFMLSFRAFSQPAPSPQSQIESHNRQAQAFLSENRPDLAIPEFRAIVTLDRNNVDALGNLGVLLFFQGDYADAVPPLRAAVRLRPTLWKPQALLGMAEKRTGDYKSAHANLAKAFPNLKEEKVKIETGMELIEMYSGTGELDKAASIADALSGLYSTNPDVLYTSYRIHSDLAAEAMLSLSMVAPKSARMRQVMAHELARKGETAAAIRNYREALKLVLCLINNFTITGMDSIFAVPCGTWRIRCPFRLSNDGRWRRGLPLVTRHRRWSSDHAWC